MKISVVARLPRPGANFKTSVTLIATKQYASSTRFHDHYGQSRNSSASLLNCSLAPRTFRIQKRFGGVTALNDGNLSVDAGEVHLLLGATVYPSPNYTFSQKKWLTLGRADIMLPSN